MLLDDTVGHVSYLVLCLHTMRQYILSIYLASAFILVQPLRAEGKELRHGVRGRLHIFSLGSLMANIKRFKEKCYGDTSNHQSHRSLVKHQGLEMGAIYLLALVECCARGVSELTTTNVGLAVLGCRVAQNSGRYLPFLRYHERRAESKAPLDTSTPNDEREVQVKGNEDDFLQGDYITTNPGTLSSPRQPGIVFA